MPIGSPVHTGEPVITGQVALPVARIQGQPVVIAAQDLLLCSIEPTTPEGEPRRRRLLPPVPQSPAWDPDRDFWSVSPFPRQTPTLPEGTSPGGEDSPVILLPSSEPHRTDMSQLPPAKELFREQLEQLAEELDRPSLAPWVNQQARSHRPGDRLVSPEARRALEGASSPTHGQSWRRSRASPASGSDLQDEGQSQPKSVRTGTRSGVPAGTVAGTSPGTGWASANRPDEVHRPPATTRPKTRNLTSAVYSGEDSSDSSAAGRGSGRRLRQTKAQPKSSVVPGRVWGQVPHEDHQAQIQTLLREVTAHRQAMQQMQEVQAQTLAVVGQMQSLLQQVQQQQVQFCTGEGVRPVRDPPSYEAAAPSDGGQLSEETCRTRDKGGPVDLVEERPRGTMHKAVNREGLHAQSSQLREQPRRAESASESEVDCEPKPRRLKSSLRTRGERGCSPRQVDVCTANSLDDRDEEATLESRKSIRGPSHRPCSERTPYRRRHDDDQDDLSSVVGTCTSGSSSSADLDTVPKLALSDRDTGRRRKGSVRFADESDRDGRSVRSGQSDSPTKSVWRHGSSLRNGTESGRDWERERSERRRRRRHHSPSSDSGSDSTDSQSGDEKQSSRDHIRLDTFDGSGSWDVFSEQFDIARKYNGWTERQALSRLKSCLRGSAAMVLLSTEAHDVSLRGLRRMIKLRYGDTQQASRYRSELPARRRGRGETLQALYADVSRLVTLAHPGPPTEFSHRLAVEAFVDTLDDAWLEERVANSEPSTLEQAYHKAIQFETNRRKHRSESDHGDRSEHKRERHVRSSVRPVSSSSEDSDTPTVVRVVETSKTRKKKSSTPARPKAVAVAAAPHIEPSSGATTGETKALLLALEANNKAMEQMRELVSGLTADVRKVEGRVKGGAQGGKSRGTPGNAKDVTCFRCNKRGHYASQCTAPAPSGGRGSNPGEKECFKCHQKGHLKRDCPVKVQASAAADAESSASGSS